MMADQTNRPKEGAEKQTDWKVPDPSMPDRSAASQASGQAPKAGIGVSAAQTENQSLEATEDGVTEFRRSPMLGVFIAVFFSLILAGVATGIYFYRSGNFGRQSSGALIPATKWIAGEQAEKRFSSEWDKARMMNSLDFDDYASKLWTLQEAYFSKPYDQQFQQLENQKTDLFRQFVRDDLMALVVPYRDFFSGEKSANSNRYQLQVAQSEGQSGDGGYRILRTLLSFKLPVEVAEQRLSSIINQRQISDTAVKVRVLFSIYHSETDSDVQKVRPMDLPPGAKRFNTLNRFVTMTKVDVLLSADIIGIALETEDKSSVETLMKAYAGGVP